MNDFNLEDEYALLLELIEQSFEEFNNPTVKHFGVKGMKWGVRKDRSSEDRNPVKGLGPDKLVRKTKYGEEITISKQPPSSFVQFVARRSEKYKDEANRFAYVNLIDSKGKRVGEAQLFREKDDSINLIWLGVRKDARGKGYATAAMSAAVEFGRQTGAKKLTLEVPGNSPDARHIYEGLGFKSKGTMIGNKNDVWGGLNEMEYVFDKEEVKHMFKSRLPDEVVLRHYGVKGMKWGVRRDTTPTAVTLKQTPGKLVKAKGGKNQPASEDAVKVAELRQKAKKSTTDSLSTQELQALVSRMNLEQQYDNLSKNGLRDSKGKKAVRTFLGDPKNKELTLEAIGKGAAKAAVQAGGGRAATIGIQVGAAIARGVVQGASKNKKK